MVSLPELRAVGELGKREKEAEPRIFLLTTSQFNTYLAFLKGHPAQVTGAHKIVYT
jgi:hypothetical protein